MATYNLTNDITDNNGSMDDAASIKNMKITLYNNIINKFDDIIPYNSDGPTTRYNKLKLCADAYIYGIIVGAIHGTCISKHDIINGIDLYHETISDDNINKYINIINDDTDS